MTLGVLDVAKNKTKVDLEKLQLISSPDGNAYYHLQTTGNLTEGRRYNRMIRIVEPHLLVALAENRAQMMKGYAAGLANTKLPVTPRLRVLFQDSSIVELAVTDGGRNPNDRLVDIVNAGRTINVEGGTPRKPLHIVEHILMSHFAFTHSDLAESIVNLVNESSETKVIGIFDKSFAHTTYNYGRAAAMKHYDVYRPFPPGDVVKGFGFSGAEKLEFYTYLRSLPNVSERSPDLYHKTRHLWHDKTTIIDVKDLKGRQWTYLATGSLNASKHAKNNADLQLLFRLNTSSDLATVFRESIMAPINNEKSYIYTVEEAVFIDLIARLTGRREFDVTKASVREFISTIGNLDFKRSIEIMDEISLKETSLRVKPRPIIIEKRLQLFFTILQWYGSLEHFDKLSPENWKRKVVALMNVVTQRLNRKQVYSALGVFLYERGASDEIFRERINTIQSFFITKGLQLSGVDEESDLKPLPDLEISKCARRFGGNNFKQ